MAADGTTNNSDARATLQLLEVRLRRLEFLLTGKCNPGGIPEEIENVQHSDESVASQLNALQAGLDRLHRLEGTAGALVREVEAIYSSVPELSSSEKPSPSRDLGIQAALVLSHASLFPESASRLSSLRTLQVPPAEQSSKLTDVRGRIDTLRHDQQQLDDEVQQLQQRSARCLEWWVNTGVFGMGDLWEEWEDHLIEIQRHVARFERRQKEVEGYV